VEVKSYDGTDPTVDAYITEIYESYAQLGNRIIAESKVDLITHDKDGNRLVRNAETNLGDFCSEAFRVMTNSDIAFVNGGGIRASIEAGAVTFNDIFSVFPFNNQVVTAEISGRTLMDFLEMAMKEFPKENGAFPHMSGITFSVNKSIPSSVKVDENGFFEKVEGEYRVYNVKILDKKSGEYKALELDGKYVFSAINYYISEFGGGMTMFKDANVLDNEGTLDVEMLENYIAEHLNGVIGEEYAEVKPNITFTDGVVSDDSDDNDEPLPPQAGDFSHVAVWGLLAIFSLSVIIASRFRHGKKAQ
jgi:2',3'-cyclic-nucleotide 2'-phosphodiesterase (5'-nucleotidase family)